MLRHIAVFLLAACCCFGQGGAVQQPSVSVGACCVPAHIAKSLCVSGKTAAQCMQNNAGLYLGDDSKCDIKRCAKMPGACCTKPPAKSTACVNETTLGECVGVGRRFAGFGANCDACAPVAPAVNSAASAAAVPPPVNSRLISVSGHVTDEISGTGIADATVVLLSATHMRLSETKTHGSHGSFSFSVTVNEKVAEQVGPYSIVVSEKNLVSNIGAPCVRSASSGQVVVYDRKRDLHQPCEIKVLCTVAGNSADNVVQTEASGKRALAAKLAKKHIGSFASSSSDDDFIEDSSSDIDSDSDSDDDAGAGHGHRRGHRHHGGSGLGMRTIGLIVIISFLCLVGVCIMILCFSMPYTTAAPAAAGAAAAGAYPGFEQDASDKTGKTYKRVDQTAKVPANFAETSTPGIFTLKSQYLNLSANVFRATTKNV